MSEPKLLSVLFKFDSRYYEKYDCFSLNGVKFVCLDRPFQLDGYWYVRALPVQEVDVKFVESVASRFLGSEYP